jgi:hypothetical protein
MDTVVDIQFLIWGTAYVVLKWTVGLWTFRRVKAYVAARRQSTAADDSGLGSLYSYGSLLMLAGPSAHAPNTPSLGEQR